MQTVESEQGSMLVYLHQKQLYVHMAGILVGQDSPLEFGGMLKFDSFTENYVHGCLFKQQLYIKILLWTLAEYNLLNNIERSSLLCHFTLYI